MPTITKPRNANRKPANKGEKSTERKVIHPKLAVAFCLRSEGNALTAEQAREILGWRKTTESKETQFTDIAGELIVCDHNLDNREFDTKKALSYAQDILAREWADSGNSDPNDPEPMTINGGTFVVNRYGELEDGQKRLAALVFASQIWNGEGELGRKQGTHWKKIWPEEPTMEALIVYGTSPSRRVRQTRDTGQVRNLQDMLYTDGYFGDKDAKTRSALTRTLAVALQFLWHRVWGSLDSFHPSLTHSTILDLLDRHGGKKGRLVQAVEHIATENILPVDRNGTPIPQAKRKISRYVASGTAAGLLYLMGCAATERDDYINADPPSDKYLDWELWDRACEFWTSLAKGGTNFKEVRLAFDACRDYETGAIGGTIAERIAILTLAWYRWAENHSIREQDVSLMDDRYKIERDQEGNVTLRKLVTHPQIDGIDAGVPKKEEPGESIDPPEEELPNGPNGGIHTNGDGPEEERRIREQLENGKPEEPKPAKGKKGKTPPTEEKSLDDQLAELKEQHAGKLLLFKVGGQYRAYTEDATTLYNVLKTPVKSNGDISYAEFPAKNLAGNVLKLSKTGHKSALCEQVNGETVVTDSATD